MSTSEKSSSRVRIGDWPRLTRFYGISPLELQVLPNWVTHLYLGAIDVIEAEEQMNALEVSAFPHYDDDTREGIVRRLEIVMGIEDAPTVDLTTPAGQYQMNSLGFSMKVTSMSEEKERLEGDA